MESKLKFSFPVEGNPRLEGKPHEALTNIEIFHLGLYWPDLDEDLSISGILSGDYGQRPSRAT